MKKSLLLVLVTISMASSLQAQEAKQPEKKNIIKTDIASLAELRYDLNLQWEHAIGKHSSTQIGFVMQDRNWYFNRFGFSFSASYRYYFSRKKYLMKGFYISPFVRYSFGQSRDVKYVSGYGSYGYTLKFNPQKYHNYSYMQAGLKVGYQWQIKNKWVIDANAGARVYPDFSNIVKSQILPELGLQIGYKF